MNDDRNYSSTIINSILEEITPEEFEKTEKRMLLAERIDEAIRNKGWRKNQFAKKMGKSPSEVSKWLSGTHNFTSDTLFEIERILDINLVNLSVSTGFIYKTFFFSTSNILPNNIKDLLKKERSVITSLKPSSTFIANSNQGPDVKYTEETCR